MTDNETGIIEHLIQIESAASSVLTQAEDDAVALINSAKAKAEEEFLSIINTRYSELEKQFSNEANLLNDKNQSEINQYKEKIHSSEQDKAGFNKLMDSLLGVN